MTNKILIVSLCLALAGCASHKASTKETKENKTVNKTVSIKSKNDSTMIKKNDSTIFLADADKYEYMDIIEYNNQIYYDTLNRVTKRFNTTRLITKKDTSKIKGYLSNKKDYVIKQGYKEYNTKDSTAKEQTKDVTKEKKNNYCFLWWLLLLVAGIFIGRYLYLKYK